MNKKLKNILQVTGVAILTSGGLIFLLWALNEDHKYQDKQNYNKTLSQIKKEMGKDSINLSSVKYKK